MKKIVTIIALVIGLLAMTASAQVPSKPFSVSFGGGLSKATGDASNGDTYKIGFHGTARVGFNILPKIQALVGVDYHKFPLSVALFNALTDGGDLTALMFAVDAKLSPGLPAMNPYAFAGFGLASVKQSELSVLGITVPESGVDTQTKFFVELGAGLEKGFMFFQVKYVTVFMPDEKWSYIPFTLGIKF